MKRIFFVILALMTSHHSVALGENNDIVSSTSTPLREKYILACVNPEEKMRAQFGGAALPVRLDIVSPGLRYAGNRDRVSSGEFILSVDTGDLAAPFRKNGLTAQVMVLDANDPSTYNISFLGEATGRRRDGFSAVLSISENGVQDAPTLYGRENGWHKTFAGYLTWRMQGFVYMNGARYLPPSSLVHCSLQTWD